MKVKTNLFCQIQIGMFISDLKKCDLILYAPSDGSILVINVYFSSLYINHAVEKLKLVYFKYLLKNLVSFNTSNKENNKEEVVKVNKSYPKHERISVQILNKKK